MRGSLYCTPVRRTTLLRAAGFAALLASAPGSVQAQTVTAQIDRYARGEHDAIVRQLEAIEDLGGFEALLEALRQEVPAWVAAVPEAQRPARRLAAATFALEAARAADSVDWKWVRRLKAQAEDSEGADRIFWKAPPLLIEWGCALLRQHGSPTPQERTWHLAAIAVAHRAGDFEFLIGSPWDARMNPPDEISHLDHASQRFPDEPRFALAAAIAVEWRTWPAPRYGGWLRQQAEAMSRLKGLTRDEAVGAEAMLRLGALHARLMRTNDALTALAAVETMTRERYLIYLARYFKGALLERRGYGKDAEAAYRAALDVIPQAQSATLALAALLSIQDRRAEAAALIEAQLATEPQPIDPWRQYGTADDRFWPELAARLRAEIAR